MQHDDEQAIALFREAAMDSPSHSDPHQQLAEIYAVRGDLGQALGHASNAVENNPHAGDLRTIRAKVLARLGEWDMALEDFRRAAAAHRLALSEPGHVLEPLPIPARDLKTPASAVDLSNFYSCTLDDFSLEGEIAEEAVAKLPSGVTTFGGVTFDARGVIRLAENGALFWRFPRSIPGIPIQNESERLHFLHTYVGRSAVGATAARLEVAYSDGEIETFEFTYGINGQEFNVVPVAMDPSADDTVPRSVAVTAPPMALYHTTWRNPRPASEIVYVSLTGGADDVSTLILGITTD